MTDLIESKQHALDRIRFDLVNAVLLDIGDPGILWGEWQATNQGNYEVKTAENDLLAAELKSARTFLEYLAAGRPDEFRVHVDEASQARRDAEWMLFQVCDSVYDRHSWLDAIERSDVEQL